MPSRTGVLVVQCAVAFTQRVANEQPWPRSLGEITMPGIVGSGALLSVAVRGEDLSRAWV